MRDSLHLSTVDTRRLLLLSVLFLTAALLMLATPVTFSA